VKGSYLYTPGLATAVFELLNIVYPGIGDHAAGMAAMGAKAGSALMHASVDAPGRAPVPGSVAGSVCWDQVSMPFTMALDGKVVAHVGVIELPMIIMGTRTTVATMHAVATHPEYRRRGFYRTVMEEALEYCSGHLDTQILTTEHPEYFEPFGFRHVQEHRFRCIRPRDISAGARRGAGGGGFRLLNLDAPADLAALFTLLGNREAVSQVAGIVRERAIFCFNESWRPLYYDPDLDTIICIESEGDTLRLYDIVSRRIPTLGEVLERLPHAVSEVLIHFSPDRLDAGSDPEPYLLDHDGPSHLMVRGPFPADAERFTIPRSGRT